jgi:hypothetical protein
MTSGNNEPVPSGARAGARDSFFLLTMLHDAEGREIGQARVRNLSSTGMLADCTASVRMGMRLTFDLRGIGAISGEVMRVEKGRIGVRFDTEIDPNLARRPPGKSIPIGPRPQLFKRQG